MPPSAALLSLPSPPSPVIFEAGPLTLRYFGLFVTLGIVAGAWLTARELARKGYDGILAYESLFVVVPMGLLGARLYHVATEYESYADPFPTTFLEFWKGGVGVYGAVAGGFLGILLFGLYRGVSPLLFADAAAPGFVLGQAIGRWGNFFNQELFGRPSDLPWAIRIDPQNRLAPFADATSFHPAFLYESIWDALVCLALLWIARRFSGRLKDGDLFLIYLVLYPVGRFFVETLRVDPTTFLIWDSIRGNLLLSAGLALGFALLLSLRHSRSLRKRSGPG